MCSTEQVLQDITTEISKPITATIDFRSTEGAALNNTQQTQLEKIPTTNEVVSALERDETPYAAQHTVSFCKRAKFPYEYLHIECLLKKGILAIRESRIGLLKDMRVLSLGRRVVLY